MGDWLVVEPLVNNPTPLTLYKHMRTFLFLAISTALLFQVGCGGGGSNLPEGFPKLHPVTITITQDSKPLEGATVTLVPKESSTYSTSGTTDASGNATLRTYGYDGAPAGEYAVVVAKVGSENQREEKTPEGETSLVGGESYRYTDEKFAKADTTSLTITVVEKKGAKESFEIGAPVHDFLGKNE
jgi:hypothetical protein